MSFISGVAHLLASACHHCKAVEPHRSRAEKGMLYREAISTIHVTHQDCGGQQVVSKWPAILFSIFPLSILGAVWPPPQCQSHDDPVFGDLIGIGKAAVHKQVSSSGGSVISLLILGFDKMFS